MASNAHPKGLLMGEERLATATEIRRALGNARLCLTARATLR